MAAVVFPNLGQIRQRVRFFIDEPTQANFLDSDLNWAINTAQQEVATEISLVDEQYFVATTPTIITTVSGTRFYPLATDFWKMTRFEDMNTGLRLDFGNFADQDNFSSSSIPLLVNNSQGYSPAIVGNSLALTPTPAVSGNQFNYWYVPVLQDLISDTDVSVIPRMFVDLLAIKAAIDALIKDEDDSSSLERKYQQRFNQLVRGTRDRQQQNPKRVTRTSSSDWIL